MPALPPTRLAPYQGSIVGGGEYMAMRGSMRELQSLANAAGEAVQEAWEEADQGLEGAYEHVGIPDSATGDTDELPERLAGTLDHIIGQLDIITRTVSIMEQRLSTNEDRLKEVEDTQSKILESLDLDH